MVAFPNWCQHKVVGLENTAPGVDQGGSDTVAKRKIVRHLHLLARFVRLYAKPLAS